jgi:hypothetical protein
VPDDRPRAHNSTLPARSGYMSRGTGFAPSGPWSRPVPVLSAGMAGSRETGKIAATKRQPISPVSRKRAAENRERAALIKKLYPERPRCVRPGCPWLADDIHENLSRARSGGIITDPDMWRPLCRRCHDEITFRPESELQWAYDAGLLVHSWDAAGGAA